MDHGTQQMNPVTPFVVATGFTTSLLGDERTLREFVVGDHMRSRVYEKGLNAILYLVNDSYDPLTVRQLRIGVNKDPGLIRQFERYCGRPIAEVPDPFACHARYSEHFAEALLGRLHRLGIYPTMIDSYRAYRAGHYDPFIAITMQNYPEIQECLSSRFDHYALRNLFRVQCMRCDRIDKTEIRRVNDGTVDYDCTACGGRASQPLAEVRGKLSWKLDCSARWNLYRIDMEVFSKSHGGELGTLAISRFLSEKYYGGRVPRIVMYGDMRVSRELSNQLLHLLPPNLLKEMLTGHFNKDLDITRDTLETFGHKLTVRPGTSYVDFVRRELPVAALRDRTGWTHADRGAPPGDGTTDGSSVVPYANRFSRFFYNREHRIRQPGLHALESADPATVWMALGLIEHALRVRRPEAEGNGAAQEQIKSFMLSRGPSPTLYQFLRRLLAQQDGPNISTILAVLPVDYIEMVRQILTSFCRSAGAHAARPAGDQDAVGQNRTRKQGGDPEVSKEAA